MAPGTARDGSVAAIRGAVVDVAVAMGPLAAINDALSVEAPGHAPVLVEVQTHLDEIMTRTPCA